MPMRLAETHDDYRSLTPAEDTPAGAIAVDQAMRPYRELALAVVSGALIDLARVCYGGKIHGRGSFKAPVPRRLTEADAAKADTLAAELADNPTLCFWAETLEMNAAVLVEAAVGRIKRGEAVCFTTLEETPTDMGEVA